MFVVCSAHSVDSITSKSDCQSIELSEDARKIITQTKLYERDKLKEEFQQNISLNKTRESLLLDETLINDELAVLKVENDLLKQLNKELMDKNEILKEFAGFEKTINNVKAPTYAEISKSDKKITGKIIPNIIVKPIDKKDRNADKNVKIQLLENISVPIKKIITKKSGDVSIRCNNKEDVNRTKALLSEKLKNEYHVEVQTFNLPRIKILDIQNDLNINDLEEDIKNRNSHTINGGFTIIGEYKNKSTGRTLILEVAPEIHDNIVKNGYRIYVGFQCCKRLSLQITSKSVGSLETYG
ncbi:hypothetical protein EVAR_97190_1 [Eumeta japonica]|uniref:Uncharacterized protein n=1 Tax=Eumeta variegata TaxID=151549 RepID=A0A4C1WIL7_EUMVA|nr:hypothetical protein EVAR_97190_1 [Eumeta japonica]